MRQKLLLSDTLTLPFSLRVLRLIYKQLLMFIQYEIVHILHDPLEREFNHVAAGFLAGVFATLKSLYLVAGAVFLILEIFFLLEVIFLPGLVEEPPLEGLRGVKVAFLSGHGLLILKHLLVDFPNHPKLMDVDLDFVLEVLKHPKDR